jgi:hypothetical protein
MKILGWVAVIVGTFLFEWLILPSNPFTSSGWQSFMCLLFFSLLMVYFHCVNVRIMPHGPWSSRLGACLFFFGLGTQRSRCRRWRRVAGLTR